MRLWIKWAGEKSDFVVFISDIYCTEFWRAKKNKMQNERGKCARKNGCACARSLKCSN